MEAHAVQPAEFALTRDIVSPFFVLGPNVDAMPLPERPWTLWGAERLPLVAVRTRRRWLPRIVYERTATVIGEGTVYRDLLVLGILPSTRSTSTYPRIGEGRVSEVGTWLRLWCRSRSATKSHLS